MDTFAKSRSVSSRRRDYRQLDAAERTALSQGARRENPEDFRLRARNYKILEDMKIETQDKQTLVYEILFWPDDERQLFFKKIEVRFIIFPDNPQLNPVITFTCSGMVKSSESRQYEDVRIDELPTSLDLIMLAKEKIVPKLLERSDFPPLLTVEQVEQIEKQREQEDRARKIKRNRNMLTKQQIEYLLQQYDNQKGTYRWITGDPSFIKELRIISQGFSETLQPQEIEHLYAFLRRYSTEKLGNVSGDVYMALSLALAEINGLSETLPALLPNVKMDHIERVNSSDDVFIDTKGQLWSVTEIAHLLQEKGIFAQPGISIVHEDGTVTSALFSGDDVARLAAYGQIRRVIDGYVDSYRQQGGKVSPQTIQKIRELAVPVSNYNTKQDPNAEKRANDAIYAFHEYCQNLSPEEKEALFGYRFSMTNRYYTSSEKSTNLTFGEFLRLLSKECNEQTGPNLKSIADFMQRGTGGEKEAEKWASIQTRPRRIDLPELRFDPETTEEALKKLEEKK